VGHLHGARPVDADDLDQPAPLECLDVGRVDELLGGVERHLLADRDDLQRRPAARVEEPKPFLDELAQPFLWPFAREQDAATTPARLAFDGRHDQLADEQRVATAQPPDAVDQRRRDTVAERGEDELLGGVTGQWTDVAAVQQLVLPQRDEPWRQGFARPHAHQDADRRLRNGQVQQRDRRLVEEMGVVDDEQEAAGAHALVQPGQRQVEKVVSVVGVVAGCQPMGERPERDVPRRLRRLHPLDGVPVVATRLDHLGHQAGLADPCAAEHGDTPRPSIGTQQASEIGELVVPPDKRPVCDHGGGCYPAYVCSELVIAAGGVNLIAELVA
jgi:hypothetical protein